MVYNIGRAVYVSAIKYDPTEEKKGGYKNAAMIKNSITSAKIAVEKIIQNRTK